MSSGPTNAPLTLYRGRTFRKVARWETTPFLIAAIATMTQSGIVQITTQAAHGIPDGWRVAVVDAKGMTELNAQNNPPKNSDFREATVKSPTSIELNEISSASYRAYTSGGFLKWYSPHDLTGYTARMKVKNKVGGTTLLNLTTENGGIFVDPVEHLIELFISDADTTAITWSTGVYDLEMVAPSGDVTVIFTGAVTTINEITT